MYPQAFVVILCIFSHMLTLKLDEICQSHLFDIFVAIFGGIDITFVLRAGKLNLCKKFKKSTKQGS